MFIKRVVATSGDVVEVSVLQTCNIVSLVCNNFVICLFFEKIVQFFALFSDSYWLANE